MKNRKGKEVDLKILDSKSNLILDHTFFGHIMMQMAPQPMPNGMAEAANCYTMLTDGTYIYYHPDFVLENTRGQNITVLVHEVLHYTFGHFGRLNGRDMTRWNMATDYVINQIMDDEGINDWPDCGVLLDEKYRGMTAEQVYELIPEEEVEERRQGKRKGMGDFTEGSKDPVEKMRELAKVQARIKQAVIMEEKTNKAGKMSDSLSRMVKDLIAPEFPWKAIMRRFVTQRSKVKRNWAKPRRAITALTKGAVVLPTRDGRTTGPIVVAVDTSGSIDHKLLKRFMSEVKAIRDECNPSELHIIDCDAEIQNHWVYTKNDAWKFPDFTGGGGTSFQPVFERVAKDRIDPVALLYFTDMYADFNFQKPKYPTMWISYSEINTAPWGTVIQAK